MCFSIQVDRKLNRLATRFEAQIDRASFENFQSLKEINPKLYKGPDADDRIFPNSYAPVIVLENNQRIIKPMRYRVRPRGSSEEVPSKFNLFNARLDSLESRKTWNSLFMQQHCLIPLLKFFEWVEHEGRKRLISFYPKDCDYHLAPGLFETWQSPDKKESINSFAIITTDPPFEIEEMGHDRCPIYLREEYLNEWLTPQKSSKSDIYELLDHQARVTYSNEWVS